MNAARAFMRREDYQPRTTPPGSLCRAFLVSCLHCASFDVRLLSQSDEDAGEVALVLVCRRCQARERLSVR